MNYRHFATVIVSLFIIGLPSINYAENGRELHYSCRIDSNRTVVTTDDDVAAGVEKNNDPLFMKKTEYHPLDLTGITDSYFSDQNNELKYFEEALVEELVKKTGDWKVGTSKTIALDGQDQGNISEEDSVITIKRKKVHAKEIRYLRTLFSQMTGSELEVGAIVRGDRGITGSVVEITGDEVRVTFEPEKKENIDETFGPVIVTDTGNGYQVEIDVEEGKLVRVGPAVGRIAQVDENYFTVDYSHPYGGKTLECDVTVSALSKDAVKIDGETESEETNQNKIEVNNEKTETEKVPVTLDVPAKTAETGDLATIEYTAYLGSGEVIWTTKSDVANDTSRKKVEGFAMQASYSPVDVLIGSEDSFPRQAADIAGMYVGEDKTIVIAPEDAYGNRNGSLLKTFDRVKTIPVTVFMSAQDYVTKFEGFPTVGKTVEYNAYLKGEVAKVDDSSVVLKLSPVENEIEEKFGYTRISVSDGEIIVKLEPKLGSDFILDDQTGRVVAVDDAQFTVDFNDPLAGNEVKVDVRLVSLIKAEKFAGKDIPWVEDYEEGLSLIEKTKKPAVLMLYADWCHYCEKMFEETYVDPRIKMMNDDFVWIKVNSDQQKEIKTFYEQKSFPLIVLMDSSGDVIEKISGYKPASEFRTQLQNLIEKDRSGNRLAKMQD